MAWKVMSNAPPEAWPSASARDTTANVSGPTRTHCSGFELIFPTSLSSRHSLSSASSRFISVNAWVIAARTLALSTCASV
jgi:hypothetical protein